SWLPTHSTLFSGLSFCAGFAGSTALASRVPKTGVGLTACRGDGWRDTVENILMIDCGHVCGGTDGARHVANDLPRCLSGLRPDPSLARARPQSRARHHAVPDGGPRRPCASLS